MKLNLATILTLVRIAAIPVIVACFYWKAPYARPLAGILFGIAAITDLIDGYIARNYGQMSRFGAFLDPVADKLIVVAALVVLLQLGRVEPVIALIIIGREIAISALREWMAKIGRSGSVAVAYVGKVKTASQMIAIPLLLFHDDVLGVLNAQWLGTILINAAAVLTVISMLHYLRRALPHARG